MSKPIRRHGSPVYYSRRVVPKELQAVLGKRDIWRSLGTKDCDEAKRLNRLQQVKWDNEFAEARAGLAAKAEPVTKLSPSIPSREQYEYELEFEAMQPIWDQEQEEHEERMRVDPLYKAQSQMAAALRQELFQRELNAEVKEEERLARAAAKRSSPAAGETSLLSVVDMWAAERKPTQKTVDRMKAVVRWFEDQLGRIPVQTLTTEDVQAFREALLKKTTPSNARVKLSNLRALLRFATQSAPRIITSNPAAEVSITVKPSPATKRTAFKAVALNTIFGSPVYTEGLRPAGGGGEASYWLPLLALYTGARLEELGQLRPRDIAQVPYTDGDGGNQIAWVIVITEDPADGLKLKNAWSARHVPVHPVLIDLGFIAYVEAMKDRKNAKGQPRIFPDLRPDKYGTETANFSKWFNRYLRDPLGIADRRLVFHSFRHSFAHYARENEIPKPVSGAITAHKSKDVGDSYGEVDFPMRPLVEGMRRYRVPGLILPPGSSHSPTA